MKKQSRDNRIHTGEWSGKANFLIDGLLPIGKEQGVIIHLSFKQERKRG